MITVPQARMLAQEHAYRPLTGKFLCLGRQWIRLTHDEAVKVLRDEGVRIPEETIAATRGSIDNYSRYAIGHNYITDQAFFKLLGLERIYSLDVSEYEKCDIVHNLNRKIPAELAGQFDFIYDGGTFDHLVDLANCFENVIEMLKPGGRVFQLNAASNFTGAAYISFGPDLFHDYYSLNKFADCKVYIAEADDLAQVFDWDMYYFENPTAYQHFMTRRLQMVLVMAEKASDSTSHEQPVQAQYRVPEIAARYLEGHNRISRSTRPVWKCYTPRPGGPEPTKAPPGFRYLGQL